MATVTVVRYKRRKRLGDDKSPMMYLLKPKAGESNRVNRVAFGGRRVACDEILCPCDEKSACGRE